MDCLHRGIGRDAISRRRLLGGAAAAALAAAGASVGRGRGFDGPAVGAAAARAQGAVTLPFWTPGGSPTYCETHTEIAADYAQVDPNVTVQFQCGTGEGFMERLLGSIAAGNPPEAAVLWDTPVSLGVQGALRPLDELMPTGEFTPEANWPENVLASCRFAGQTYALPVVAPTYGIWYNQDLFESKGIPADRASFPKTWDELRRLSKEFTRWEDDRLASVGFWLWEISPYSLGGTIPVWSALNGGQIFDAANQRYTIDAEPNVEMFDYFVSWLDEEFKGDYATVLRSGAWGIAPSEAGQPPQFQAGNLAMTELGSFGMGDIYSLAEMTFERWDVAPYPVGPSGTETKAAYWPSWLVIPTGTEHPEQAFGYLDYMSGVGVQKWFATTPDIPTNRKVPTDLLPQVAVERRGEEFAVDIAAFFRGQLDVATPMWDSPVQNFAIDQLLGAMERIMTKQSAPRDALAEAQQASQAELEKVLRANG